jgi:hypothetical protein
MLLPWPLTTSAELAGVLRPGGHLRPDSSLRTLRERGLSAEAITVVPRSARGAHGRVVWYSSLMIDVARLLRLGDQGTATEVHTAATRLAAHRAARFVAEWLVAEREPEPDPARLDTETGGALTRLAILTASARAKFLPRLAVRTHAGRVTDVVGGTAMLVTEDGEQLSIPAPAESSNAWTNALVSVDIERMPGGAITLWVRPAFDPDADPRGRVPGGPHILTPAERERLKDALASAR